MPEQFGDQHDVGAFADQGCPGRAKEIGEAGGQGEVWLARMTSAAQERALAARMAAAVTVEYEQVIATATTAASQRRPPGAGR
jgi:hypothetical protein